MPRGKKTEVTQKLRNQVKKLAKSHLTWPIIADIVEIKESTLRRHCTKDFQEGKAKGLQQLAHTAMQMACSGKHPAMTIFMLKTQLKWRETELLEHEIKPTTVIFKRGPDRPSVKAKNGPST